MIESSLTPNIPSKHLQSAAKRVVEGPLALTGGCLCQVFHLTLRDEMKHASNRYGPIAKTNSSSRRYPPFTSLECHQRVAFSK